MRKKQISLVTSGEFLVKRLKDHNMDFVKDPLHAALEEGRAIVFLDGLDEIADKERQSFVRQSVAAFADRYPGSRMVHHLSGVVLPG